MEHYNYSISPEIFARFPGYVRGVVIAHGVTNGPSPAELVKMLREAEASVRDRLDPEQIAEVPRIKSWREAYRAFGAKPAEFRSSVEAMVRRALRGDELPRSTLWSIWATSCPSATCCRPALTPSTSSTATSSSASPLGTRTSWPSARRNWSTRSGRSHLR